MEIYREFGQLRLKVAIDNKDFIRSNMRLARNSLSNETGKIRPDRTVFKEVADRRRE
jgi:hypothetical protein